MARGAEVLAEGELRHVFVDVETKQRKAVPNEVRQALEPYLGFAPAPA